MIFSRGVVHCQNENAPVIVPARLDANKAVPSSTCAIDRCSQGTPLWSNSYHRNFGLHPSSAAAVGRIVSIQTDYVTTHDSPLCARFILDLQKTIRCTRKDYAVQALTLQCLSTQECGHETLFALGCGNVLDTGHRGDDLILLGFFLRTYWWISPPRPNLRQ